MSSTVRCLLPWIRLAPWGNRRRAAPRPRWGSLLPEDPRSEILEIATPRLPLVVRAGRFPVDVLDARLGEAIVQSTDTRGEPLGLRGADTQVQHVHLVGASRRVREHDGEIRLEVDR